MERDTWLVLPTVAKRTLTHDLQKVKRQHEADLMRGTDWGEFPWALARTHPLEDGTEIRTVQELLRHHDVNTRL